MDDKYYLFTKNDGRIIVLDEKQADRQLFYPSNWEAKDIKYVGRIPRSKYQNIIEENLLSVPWIKDAGSVSPEQQKDIQDKKIAGNKLVNQRLLDVVAEVGDKGEPRDFRILDQNGNYQTSDKVRNSI